MHPKTTGEQSSRLRHKTRQPGAGANIEASSTSRAVLDTSIEAAEKARNTSEIRYRWLFENNLDAIINVNREGRFLSVNPAAEALSGYSSKELKSMTFVDLCVSEHLAKTREAFMAIMEARHHPGIATAITRKDGKRVELFVSGAASKDKNGHTTGIFCIARDITLQKHADLRRSLTIELLELFNRSSSTRYLMRAVTAFIQRHSGCDAVGIRLREEKRYRYFESHGFPYEFDEVKSGLCDTDSNKASGSDSFSVCICETLLRDLCPFTEFLTDSGTLFLPDVAAFETMLSKTRNSAASRIRCVAATYQSVVLIPLGRKNDRIGLLQLNSLTKGYFTPEGVSFWERMAAKLSIAISKFQTEDALRKAHSQLQRRAREIEVMMDAVPAAIFVAHDVECRRMSGSHFTQELLGLPATANFSRTAPPPERHFHHRSLRNGCDIPAAELPVQRAARGHLVIDYEYDLLFEDGRIRTLFGNAVPIPDEAGQPCGAVGAFIDITEHKKTEHALQEAQAKLRARAKDLEKTVALRTARLRERTTQLQEANVALKASIAEHKITEFALKRANRALLTLKECDEALARASSESELLQNVCQIILKIDGMKAAWVGFAENDKKKTVRPVAHSGNCSRYLKNVRVTWADEAHGRGPIGAAIRSRNVNVCRDIGSDERLAPWRTQLLRSYNALIALPLVWEDHCHGALTIYSAHADAFNEQEVNLLTRLARDLTYGIVAIRTRKERERLQEELLKISEREKQIAAQELHDGVCQHFAGTALMGSLLHRRLAAREDPEADYAKQICGLLNTGVHEARTLSHSLHPVKPEGDGLIEALSGLAQSVTRLFHVQCKFRCEEAVSVANQVTATHLFRIAQEAINNAMKHAQATRVLLTLKNDDLGVILKIRDNGVGIPRHSARSRGMGLEIMSHRAAVIGATLLVHRAGRRGTEVICTLAAAS